MQKAKIWLIAAALALGIAAMCAPEPAADPVQKYADMTCPQNVFNKVVHEQNGEKAYKLYVRGCASGTHDS